MSVIESAAPLDRPFFTRGVRIATVIAALGAAAAAYRFLFGLGAATNLTDTHPWGLWIGVDVATGVALAAGGFTTAALAHIFHRRHYEAIMRPALLSAMLGYTFVVLGLLADLGRFYNIWHPMLPSMWQGNSVLFEVAMCVMAYLTVLYLEFMPMVCERFAGRVNLPGRLSALNAPVDAALQRFDALLPRVMPVLIITGVVLSCMHQSSLGSLMLVAPYKLHPLWYTPLLPLLFLLSAIAVGYPMVILEGVLSSAAFKRKPEMHVLGPLGRFVVALLGVYLIVKTGDLLYRGAYVHLFEPTFDAFACWLELTLMAAPLFMLLSRRVRASSRLLLLSASMVIAGVALNRINVFIIGYHPPYAESRYVPSLYEILVTAGLVATLVLVYRIIVTVFPVLPAEEREDSTPDAQELIP